MEPSNHLGKQISYNGGRFGQLWSAVACHRFFRDPDTLIELGLCAIHRLASQAKQKRRQATALQKALLTLV